MTQTVPRFVVDLDQAPEKRWSGVVDAYKSTWPELLQQMHTLLEQDLKEEASFLEQLVQGVSDNLQTLGGGEYMRELRGMSARSGIALPSLVLLHLSYEHMAGCTSVLALDEHGRTILGRTLDWPLPQLRQLTIEVEFVRGTQVVFVATTWAGYVGVLTAVRPDAYAVAINFRPAMTDPSESESKCPSPWPVGFLVRHALQTQSSFERVREFLRTAPCMAPFYAIVSGAGGRGMVLTRGETAVDDETHIPTSSDTHNSSHSKGKKRKSKKRGKQPPRVCGVGWLVQANMDLRLVHDLSQDDQESLPRHRVCQSMLSSKPSAMNSQRMWHVLSAHPIFEQDVTVYATVLRCDPSSQDDAVIESKVDYAHLYTHLPSSSPLHALRRRWKKTR